MSKPSPAYKGGMSQLSTWPARVQKFGTVGVAHAGKPSVRLDGEAPCGPKLSTRKLAVTLVTVGTTAGKVPSDTARSVATSYSAMLAPSTAAMIRLGLAGWRTTRPKYAASV